MFLFEILNCHSSPEVCPIQPHQSGIQNCCTYLGFQVGFNDERHVNLLLLEETAELYYWALGLASVPIDQTTKASVACEIFQNSQVGLLKNRSKRSCPSPLDDRIFPAISPLSSRFRSSIAATSQLAARLRSCQSRLDKIYTPGLSVIENGYYHPRGAPGCVMSASFGNVWMVSDRCPPALPSADLSLRRRQPRRRVELPHVQSLFTNIGWHFSFRLGDFSASSGC